MLLGTGQEATCQSSQFGEVLLEVDCGSTWVHDIAWSLDGSKLAACTHSCVVYVVDGLDPGDPQSFTSASSNVAMITLTTLPLKALLFISDQWVPRLQSMLLTLRIWNDCGHIVAVLTSALK